MRKRFATACFNSGSNAEPFPQVILALRKWIAEMAGVAPSDLMAEHFLPVTCGNWDVKTALPRQSNKPIAGTVDFDTQELLFGRWCNLKEAFREHFKMSAGAAPTGMRPMLKVLKIPLSGQHHLGMDDVTNLCKILKV